MKTGIEARISKIKNVNFDTDMFKYQDNFKVNALESLIEKELNNLEDIEYSCNMIIQCVAEKYLEKEYLENSRHNDINIVKDIEKEIENKEKEYDNRRNEFIKTKRKLLNYYEQYEEIKPVE